MAIVKNPYRRANAGHEGRELDGAEERFSPDFAMNTFAPQKAKQQVSLCGIRSFKHSQHHHLARDRILPCLPH